MVKCRHCGAQDQHFTKDCPSASRGSSPPAHQPPPAAPPPPPAPPMPVPARPPQPQPCTQQQQQQRVAGTVSSVDPATGGAYVALDAPPGGYVQYATLYAEDAAVAQGLAPGVRVSCCVTAYPGGELRAFAAQLEHQLPPITVPGSQKPSGWGWPMYSGYVSSMDHSSGFGWVSSDELRRQGMGDAFFRLSDPTTQSLTQGRYVTFRVVPGHSPEATHVTLADMSVPCSSPSATGTPAWSPMGYSEVFPGAADGSYTYLCAPPVIGQRPWELDVVFFHAQCMDGLCAVYALWAAAGPSQRAAMQLVPVHAKPGCEEWTSAQVRGKRIALVDVSYPLPALRRLLAECQTLLVIDHHKSHEKDLTVLAETCPSCVRFDLSRAAAVLAFDFAVGCLAEALAEGRAETEDLRGELSSPLPPYDMQSVLSGALIPPPRFLQLVQEVDLGRFGSQYPETRRFAMGIEVLPFDVSTPAHFRLSLPRKGTPTERVVDSLQQLRRCLQDGDSMVDRVLALGAAVEPDVEQVIERWMATRTVRRFREFPESRVAVVELQAVDFTEHGNRRIPLRFARNELGHRLARDPLGVLCGAVVATHSVMLRCDSAQADVSRLAETFGGGGHATAAAFQLEAGQTLDDIMTPPEGQYPS
eukprot:TRINITY_DN2373_c2_g1_i1.p1 TRINITY_DN2373_c2_g1~~TRINITY_DN2373_c2_g1_i1.p1  ORF type:complete len:642 (+),score=155.82 TRINITY_DN2373_c2_g1_i1:85-2010(+)